MIQEPGQFGNDITLGSGSAGRARLVYGPISAKVIGLDDEWKVEAGVAIEHLSVSRLSVSLCARVSLLDVVSLYKRPRCVGVASAFLCAVV